MLALERATDGHNSIHQWHLKTANREHLNVTQHSEEQIFKNKTGKKVKKKNHNHEEMYLILDSVTATLLFSRVVHVIQ